MDGNATFWHDVTPLGLTGMSGMGGAAPVPRPAVQSASIDTNGTTLTIVWNQSCTYSGQLQDITLTGGHNAYGGFQGGTNGTDTWRLTLNDTVLSNETPFLSIPGGVTGAGGVAPPIIDYPVDNGSLVPPIPTVPSGQTLIFRSPDAGAWGTVSPHDGMVSVAAGGPVLADTNQEGRYQTVRVVDSPDPGQVTAGYWPDGAGWMLPSTAEDSFTMLAYWLDHASAASDELSFPLFNLTDLFGNAFYRISAHNPLNDGTFHINYIDQGGTPHSSSPIACGTLTLVWAQIEWRISDPKGQLRVCCRPYPAGVAGTTEEIYSGDADNFPYLAFEPPVLRLNAQANPGFIPGFSGRFAPASVYSLATFGAGDNGPEDFLPPPSA